MIQQFRNAMRARMLNYDSEPITDWYASYNLNIQVDLETPYIKFDLAVVFMDDGFSQVSNYDFHMNKVIVELGHDHQSYLIFHDCIISSYRVTALEGVSYCDSSFLCNSYEFHEGDSIRIIRPIRSQQSRLQVDPMIEDMLGNSLEGRHPDCGRDSDGPVDWIKDGF